MATTALSITALPGHADNGLAFTTEYVDHASGGGEGYVIWSHSANQYVYSSHEGTTLTKSANAPGATNCDISTAGASGYLCSYNNQVNIWYSPDGKTWTKSTGNPLYTGFSDPSMTEDECTTDNHCNVYDTGIDLANDALYASPDGGKTWVAGTPQCHDGDRPWLAGGKNGEVFLSTNTEEGGHEIFHGTVTQVAGQNASLTCSSTGIADSGGHGQMYYDHHDGSLIEPKTSGGKVGIGVLPNASAFTGSFQSRVGPSGGDGMEHWPSIAISTDATQAYPTGIVYAVWDTAPRTSTPPHNGCGSDTTGPGLGGNTLLQNAVQLAYTLDEGKTWSNPITVADTGGTVMWPWVVAGSNGNVAVAWYQANTVTDPDCDSANLVCQASGSNCAPSQWSIDVAEYRDILAGGAPATVNAITNFDGQHPNGTFHVGTVCEGGTTCAATGQDRRVGDFFTTALDPNGCLMIASGDTMQVAAVSGQQLPNSLPLFIHQSSGPSLTSDASCAAPGTSVPESQLAPALLVVGAAAMMVVLWRRRRLPA